MEGEFVLSSGLKSRFYVDKYLFSTEPGLLRELARALAGELAEGTERLAGVELGAVPLVAAVSLETGLPFVIVRKQKKGHGANAGGGVEGRALGRGERVTLVEDVVTTGAQALKAAAELEAAGAEIARIVAVLDRRPEGERPPELGPFDFRALLAMEDVVVQNGY